MAFENVIVPGRRNLRVPLFIYKIFKYEYWPFWLVFMPFSFYYWYLAIRARSLTYFTAANPGIELGGFFGESKIEILKKVPSKYLPTSLYFNENVELSTLLSAMESNNLRFPIICKPDKGERGYNVDKINNKQELADYLIRYNGKLIVQDYVNYECELGILYFRWPDGSGSGITSVVIKEFLGVTGDGVSTIEQLMKNSVRARFQLPDMRNRIGQKIHDVIPQGQHLLLEPIGNHCRGTRFINGKHLITPQLVKIFDEISSSMDGFYIGRFDLKVPDIDDLNRGENIKILEVNGVTSEPAHIYGPDMNLLTAWRDILKSAWMVFAVAKQNNKLGIKYASPKVVIRTVFDYFSSKN